MNARGVGVGGQTGQSATQACKRVSGSERQRGGGGGGGRGGGAASGRGDRVAEQTREQGTGA